MMMRNQTLLLLAAAAFGLAVGQASAADLPRRAPAYVPPAPPPYVWTGCYVGANVGGAWAHLKVTDVTNGVETSRSNGGIAGGGQIGCDYQMGVWVVGIRNMFDGTSISRSTTFFDPGLFGGSGTVDGHVRWFDTLTGRVGYLVQPNLLFYAQGGAAWTQADLTIFDGTGAKIGELSRNKTGWTVGGGVEWMFVPHWSVFLEYNFMGFGTRSVTVVGCGGICAFSGKADIQNVLAGVNYKF
jgi:outer membrane immunogenic protein